MQLEEQFYESSTARWKRELPWLRLFRGFRIAMDFRKLLLALAGTLIYAAGMMLFTQFPFSPHSIEDSRPLKMPAVQGVDRPMPAGDFEIATWPWDRNYPGTPMGGADLAPVLREPWGVRVRILRQAENLLAPWRIIVEPAQGVMFARTWSDFA